MSGDRRSSLALRPVPSPTTSAQVRRVTFWGLLVNLLLSAGKLVVGITGGSQALVADAVHSLSDCASDFAVVVGSYFWDQPPDESHPYGHRRIETMIAILIGVLTGLVGVGLTWNAVEALRNAERSTPTVLAGAVALASILSKEALFRWTRREGKRLRSAAVTANAWHHRSDAISSIPVLIAIAAAIALPEWWFLDQVGAIVVSGFIIKAAIEIVRPGLRELVDSAAPQEVSDAIRGLALGTQGVRGVHDLRTRYVGSQLCVDLHVEVGGAISVLEGHRIAEEVIECLKRDGPDVVDVLIHIDPYDDSVRPQARATESLTAEERPGPAAVPECPTPGGAQEPPAS